MRKNAACFRKRRFFFIFFTFSFRPVLLPFPSRITRAARCPWRLAIAVRGFAPRPYPSRCAATPASHAPPCRAPYRPRPVVMRSRCGRARCPHRAAAPSARCAAWPRALARPVVAPHRPCPIAPPPSPASPHNRQTPFSRPDATSFALLRSIRAIADFLLFC